MLCLGPQEQHGEDGCQMEQSHCVTGGTALSLGWSGIGKTEKQKYSLFCNFVDELWEPEKECSEKYQVLLSMR